MVKKTGNREVDAMIQYNPAGNIIPTQWYHTMTRNGKPYLNAIVILADIVYWYRPSIKRDEGSGNAIEYKKKFSADVLQRSRKQIGDQFGLTLKQVDEALKYLENINAIRKELRTIDTDYGKIGNVMYIHINPLVIYELTYPHECNVATLYPWMCIGTNNYVDTTTDQRNDPIYLDGKTYTEITNRYSDDDDAPAESDSQCQSEDVYEEVINDISAGRVVNIDNTDITPQIRTAIIDRAPKDKSDILAAMGGRLRKHSKARYYIAVALLRRAQSQLRSPKRMGKSSTDNYNRFMHQEYDFEKIEQELLKN